MNNSKINFKEKYADLFAIKQPEQKLYFVGGVVRDVFLNREHKDIDILCDCDTRVIARKLADQNKGAFFVLDEERNTSRVILNDNNSRQVFDFSRLQGNDINEDLALRDFTINAMAVDFDQPDCLIDPLNGKVDLLNGVLRCCSPTSFSRDSIRVVRAVRYSISCQAKLESETLMLLRKSVPGLKKISGERKRDEFFKILDTEKPALGLELMHRLEILKGFGVMQIQNPSRTFRKITTLNYLLAMVEGKRTGDANKDFFESSYHLRIGRFYSHLTEYFTKRNLSERNGRQVILLTMFLTCLDQSSQEKVIQSLLLSKEEATKVELLIEAKDAVQELISKETVTSRDIYQFYMSVEEAGLDLCLLYMAEILSQEPAAFDQSVWLHMMEVCELVISSWYEKTEIVHPILLLNGKDLMMQFDLAPGPKIGILLDKLREEQAAGVIKTRDQAIDWIEGELSHQALLDR